jgi:hypothetical protein
VVKDYESKTNAADTIVWRRVSKDRTLAIPDDFPDVSRAGAIHMQDCDNPYCRCDGTGLFSKHEQL